jgi:hypothetical protein
VHLNNGQFFLSPSDLVGYLACPHLTTLELEVARSDRVKPHTRDAISNLVAEKGDLREAAYLEQLRVEGRQIVEIELDAGDFDKSARETISFQLTETRTRTSPSPQRPLQVLSHGC